MHDLTSNEKDAVAFLQEPMVFYLRRLCGSGHEAKLYFGKQIFWKCNIKSCQKKVNMRVGNWLVGSRISFVCALRFIYCWAEEMTSLKWCQTQLNMCYDTTVDWNNYMREICVLSLKSRNVKIGGPGKIVEIDESYYKT
jgi:hypothetical protein